MRYLIPLVALFSLAFLPGCATTTTSPATSADAPAHTCCKNSPTGACVDCPACSAGEACADCAGQCDAAMSACANCAAGKACTDCDAKKNKKACATCAAGKACTECSADASACAVCAASLDQASCKTCAAGEPCAACDAKKSKDKAGDAVSADAEPVATINAKGMGCPLCASSADRRLMKIDGVKWTNIDLGNGVVTVGLDPEKPAPAAEDLQTAIRDAGFTAEDVTMPGGEVTQ